MRYSQNYTSIELKLDAPMLVGPLYRQIGAFVVVHFLLLQVRAKSCGPGLVLDGFGTHGSWTCVPALCIVLAVEEPVSIISIYRAFQRK